MTPLGGESRAYCDLELDLILHSRSANIQETLYFGIYFHLLRDAAEGLWHCPFQNICTDVFFSILLQKVLKYVLTY